MPAESRYAGRGGGMDLKGAAWGMIEMHKIYPWHDMRTKWTTDEVTPPRTNPPPCAQRREEGEADPVREAAQPGQQPAVR